MVDDGYNGSKLGIQGRNLMAKDGKLTVSYLFVRVDDRDTKQRGRGT